ncbi:MAG: exodeoxyribonuclease III [Chloroflexota bacterium]
MKITTWNVAGLRAMLKKGGWDWVKQHDPDVICLQEIKAMPEQLTEENHQLFAPYKVLWNPAEKKGYSGTLTLVKDQTVKMKKGLGVDRFDHEGRTIQAEFEEFVLFNLYVPNGGRDLGRVPFKLGFYTTLLELCNSYHHAGKQVIICGDINTAHEEIDVHNPRTKHKITGFLPEERAWITKFLSNGLVDSYRALNPEGVQYTYWSYMQNQRGKNQGWRLDYFMVSENLFPGVKDVITHQEVLGSDHCPVTLILE